MLAALLLGAGLALGTGGPAADIERTIKKAVRVAVVDHDYQRACRFGTEGGRRRLLRGYNSSSGPDFPSCAAIIRHEVETRRDIVVKLRDGIVVDVLWVRGGKARARVADGPGPFAGQGFVRLRRLDGRWRLHNSTLIPFGD